LLPEALGQFSNAGSGALADPLQESTIGEAGPGIHICPRNSYQRQVCHHPLGWFFGHPGAMYSKAKW
jgi:hypothetical protein